MARSAALAALALLAALAVAQVAAHGGALHDTTPESNNFLRTKIATCSNWVPAGGVVKYSLLDKDAPLPAEKPTVKGDVKIWAYLYQNCTLAPGEKPSAGAHFNVTLTGTDGKPLANRTLNGIAMTGTCASGGGRPFYLNASAVPLDDKHNLLWFTNGTTGPDGELAGNGANDGDVLTTADGKGVRSAMLVDTASGGALACCDLTSAGPPGTDWSATLEGKGVECVEDADGHKHPKETQDEHAGHAAGDHSAHAAANTTAQAKATSSAALARAPGIALVLVAVLALLLL